MDQLPQKLRRIMSGRINPPSLLWRLTGEIILLLTLGIGGVTLALGWELQRLPPTLKRDGRLLTIMAHLKIIGVLSLGTTATLATLSIRRSLLPLREMAQIYTAQLKPYPLGLKRLPKEIKTLARNWNNLLARFAQGKEKQQQLTNDLAHELRTPLSMIYGYLQRTQQRGEHLSDSQKEALDMAVEEAERMVQLLEDWLELIRSDGGVVPRPVGPLLLNDLLPEVAGTMAKLEQRTIQVQVPPWPVWVRAEPGQLRQVFHGLLENAIQYSQADKSIFLELTRWEDWAMIRVRDRGCGIPLSQQSLIFDPFYRVDPSRSRTTGGAGLGLSLVKGLVEGMGGEITVQSELNRGSTFTVKLPLVGAKP